MILKYTNFNIIVTLLLLFKSSILFSIHRTVNSIARIYKVNALYVRQYNLFGANMRPKITLATNTPAPSLTPASCIAIPTQNAAKARKKNVLNSKTPASTINTTIKAVKSPKNAIFLDFRYMKYNRLPYIRTWYQHTKASYMCHTYHHYRYVRNLYPCYYTALLYSGYDLKMLDIQDY